MRSMFFVAVGLAAGRVVQSSEGEQAADWMPIGGSPVMPLAALLTEPAAAFQVPAVQPPSAVASAAAGPQVAALPRADVRMKFGWFGRKKDLPAAADKAVATMKKADEDSAAADKVLSDARAELRKAQDAKSSALEKLEKLERSGRIKAAEAEAARLACEKSRDEQTAYLVAANEALAEAEKLLLTAVDNERAVAAETEQAVAEANAVLEAAKKDVQAAEQPVEKLKEKAAKARQAADVARQGKVSAERELNAEREEARGKEVEENAQALSDAISFAIEGIGLRRDNKSEK